MARTGCAPSWTAQCQTAPRWWGRASAHRGTWWCSSPGPTRQRPGPSPARQAEEIGCNGLGGRRRSMAVQVALVQKPDPSHVEWAGVCGRDAVAGCAPVAAGLLSRMSTLPCRQLSTPGQPLALWLPPHVSAAAAGCGAHLVDALQRGAALSHHRNGGHRRRRHVGGKAGQRLGIHLQARRGTRGNRCGNWTGCLGKTFQCTRRHGSCAWPPATRGPRFPLARRTCSVMRSCTRAAKCSFSSAVSGAEPRSR